MNRLPIFSERHINCVCNYITDDGKYGVNYLCDSSVGLENNFYDMCWDKKLKFDDMAAANKFLARVYRRMDENSIVMNATVLLDSPSDHIYYFRPQYNKNFIAMCWDVFSGVSEYKAYKTVFNSKISRITRLPTLIRGILWGNKHRNTR